MICRAEEIVVENEDILLCVLCVVLTPQSGLGDAGCTLNRVTNERRGKGQGTVEKRALGYKTDVLVSAANKPAQGPLDFVRRSPP